MSASITLKLPDRDIEITIDEARIIQEKLNEILGHKDVVVKEIVTVPHYIYTQPLPIYYQPKPIYPNWTTPWCGSGGLIGTTVNLCESSSRQNF